MGLEFSVFLAQWVLSYYEYRFLNECIFHKQWDLLQEFVDIVRYIDDVFAIDCPSLHSLAYQTQSRTLPNGNNLYGIYPITLKLNKEHSILDPYTFKPTQRIPMLDLAIEYNPQTGVLTHSLWDNRENPKLHMAPLTKYPMVQSLTSAHMSLNIITSQCHRYLRVCITWWQFAKAAAGVLYELYKAGHNFTHLHQHLCAFLRSKFPLYVSRSGRDNRVIHLRIFNHFSQALREGLPILEGRNRVQQFPNRVATLSPIYWPPNPPVHPFLTP